MIYVNVLLVVLLFYIAGTNAGCGEEKWFGCKQDCPSGWKELQYSYTSCCESFWSCFGSQRKCKDEKSCRCQVSSGYGYSVCETYMGGGVLGGDQLCRYWEKDGFKCTGLSQYCNNGVLGTPSCERVFKDCEINVNTVEGGYLLSTGNGLGTHTVKHGDYYWYRNGQTYVCTGLSQRCVDGVIGTPSCKSNKKQPTSIPTTPYTPEPTPIPTLSPLENNGLCYSLTRKKCADKVETCKWFGTACVPYYPAKCEDVNALTKTTQRKKICTKYIPNRQSLKSHVNSWKYNKRLDLPLTCKYNKETNKCVTIECHNFKKKRDCKKAGTKKYPCVWSKAWRSCVRNW